MASSFATTRPSYTNHLSHSGADAIPGATESIRNSHSSNIDVDLDTDTELPIREQPGRDKRMKDIPLAARFAYEDFKPRKFAKPFCKFLSTNPTVFHAASAIASDLTEAGYSKLSSRDIWTLEKGGKYFVERNGSSLIAFEVGKGYEPGNGVAMIAGHIDALTAKLKPIPKLDTKGGFVQLGVAPYAGALNSTWWDRDLAIAGRVLVKGDDGKIISKLVNIDQPSELLCAHVY